MLKIFLGLVSAIREFMLISHLCLPFYSRIFFLPLLPMCPSLSTAHDHIRKNKVKFSAASSLLLYTLPLSNPCSFGLDDVHWYA